MGAEKIDLPKKRSSLPRGKITAYPEADVEKLYKLGRENGWDVAAIAREALEEAFRSRAEELKTKAD